MEKRIAIVVLTYKVELSVIEDISMEQAKKIFRNRDCFLVVPNSLEYHYDIDGFKEMRLDNKWFMNIQSYNMLLKNEEFYKLFIEYDYILIYQLDAFAFSDQLDYFGNMNYDYIGAPWIDGEFYYKDSEHSIWHVGNGGLSLRKIESFIEILNKNKKLMVNNPMPEDLFFSTLASNDFRVAPVNVALEFSFEMNVRECYKRNRNQLPFGCHAWHRFDLEFWKPYIEGCGYEISEELLKYGQEDKDYIVKNRRKEISQFWRKLYKKEDLRAQILGLFMNGVDNFIIWGAGFWGQMLCQIMDDIGLRVSMFIDKQKFLENQQICGCDVKQPDDLQELEVKHCIIIAVINEYEGIKAFLESINYQYRRDYILLKDIDMIYQNVSV